MLPRERSLSNLLTLRAPHLSHTEDKITEKIFKKSDVLSMKISNSKVMLTSPPQYDPF